MDRRSRRERRAVALGRMRREGEILEGRRGAPCEADDVPGAVGELADVARPVVRQRARRAGGESRAARPPRSARSARRKWSSQRRDVLAAARAAAAASRRDDVEAVVEVLAEAARRRPRARGRGWWRRRRARRRGMRSRSPTRRERRGPGATRRSLACSRAGSSPISSRKSVPPSASSNEPASRGLGAGEGAALVAEELALHQRRRGARRSRRRRTAACARGCAVEGAGDELLCRCRVSPVMRTVRSVGATRPTISSTFRIAAERAMNAGAPRASSRARSSRFSSARRWCSSAARDDDLELLGGEGLGDEVAGALAHRVHGGLDGGVGRDEDDRSVRGSLRELSRTARPSMSRIIKSVTTRSKRSPASSASASPPLPTPTSSWPSAARPRMRRSVSRGSGSSSTRRIAPWRGSSGRTGDGLGWSRRPAPPAPPSPSGKGRILREGAVGRPLAAGPADGPARPTTERLAASPEDTDRRPRRTRPTSPVASSYASRDRVRGPPRCRSRRIRGSRRRGRARCPWDGRPRRPRRPSSRSR